MVGLCFVGGQQALAEAARVAINQDELAVAMRMEVAEGWPYFYDMRPIPLARATRALPVLVAVRPRLRPTGDDFGSLTSITEATDGSRGHLYCFEPPVNARSERMSGWAACQTKAVSVARSFRE